MKTIDLKMVDVSEKKVTFRRSNSEWSYKSKKRSLSSCRKEYYKIKGLLYRTAVIASIQGVKKTSELIPMCHPLIINSVQNDIKELPSSTGWRLYVTVKSNGKKGVEMEA